MSIIVCAVVFAVMVVWLHVKRTDVDHRTQGISRFAIGETRAVTTEAFIMLALGLWLLGTRLEVLLRGSPSMALIALRLTAAALALVAVFPLENKDMAAWRHWTHTVAATIFFVGAALAGLAGWDTSSALTNLIGGALAVAVALFLVSMTGVLPLFAVRGWLQRLAFALVVIWMIVAAVDLMPSLAADPAASSTLAPRRDALQ